MKFESEFKHFIEENTLENVVCEMLFISSRPRCVKEGDMDMDCTPHVDDIFQLCT